MDPKSLHKNILVAPLNWGLGHATRCIPIVRALETNGFSPILASDGTALEMLRKEFPHLKTVRLPSYDIQYPEKGSEFKWKMFKNLPTVFDAVRKERQLVNQLIDDYNLCGIISDNRLGIFSKKVRSVFITHQLNVLTGSTTWISSKVHQHIIKKYDCCWIPDFEKQPNLSGKLGHVDNSFPKTRYIGPISRFMKTEVPKKYDVMVLLSGPEPHRTILEEILSEKMQAYDGKVLFVCGRIEPEQQITQSGNITFYNFMVSDELEQAFNESERVLCRSGYTTIMDLAKLSKKAFFIPTPGQFEQEYLAKKLKRDGLVPYASQQKFRIEDLLKTDLYPGLRAMENKIDWAGLFRLFECE